VSIQNHSIVFITYHIQFAKCPRSDCQRSFKTGALEVNFSNRSDASVNLKKPRRGKARFELRGSDYRGFRPNFGPEQRYSQNWLERFDGFKLDVLPSSKLNGTLEQIQYWIKAKPNDQIIVFSQFRHFQVLLGIILHRQKIPFLYYSVR
jgi:hypothetical protein